MGVLLVSNVFMQTEKDAEFIFGVFDWLKRECNAVYVEDTRWIDKANKRMRFLIEGIGIPAGDQDIDIVCTTIVEGVHSIEINIPT